MDELIGETHEVLVPVFLRFSELSAHIGLPIQQQSSPFGPTFPPSMSPPPPTTPTAMGRTPGESLTWGTTPSTLLGWGDVTVPLRYGLDQGVELPVVPWTPSPPTTATLSPASSPCPLLTKWSTLTPPSPPLLPVSTPVGRSSFGRLERSKLSPYGLQRVTSQNSVQRYHMQVKDLFSCQLESSKDLMTILGIWEGVLEEKKGDVVLGCWNCKFLDGPKTWKYCPQSRYSNKHPSHLCLGPDCCGQMDWEWHK